MPAIADSGLRFRSFAFKCDLDNVNANQQAKYLC